MLGNGYTTGKCVNSTKPGQKTCEVYAWCPVEIDTLPSKTKPLFDNIGDYTVLIKNTIEFPRFKVKRQVTLTCKCHAVQLKEIKGHRVGFLLMQTGYVHPNGIPDIQDASKLEKLSFSVEPSKHREVISVHPILTVLCHPPCFSVTKWRYASHSQIRRPRELSAC